MRDVAILALGVYGFLHEVNSAEVEPLIMYASVAALGLPLAFRADAKKED